jgi:hypothetical protein
MSEDAGSDAAFVPDPDEPRRVPEAKADPPRSGRRGEAPQADEQEPLFSTQALVDAMGGTRGLIEATVPGLVFAVVFAFTSDGIGPALWAAVASALVILIVAVAQRRSVQQTISGFIGILFAAGIVLITGQARDFFLVGIWRNALWFGAHAISLLIRWPLIGLLLGPFTGEGTAWRRDPRRLRAYMWCSVVWLFVFGIRLAVQVPLFRDDEVVALGVVGVFLGLPLFLIACAINFVILVRVPLAKRDDAASDGDDAEPPHPPMVTPG